MEVVMEVDTEEDTVIINQVFFMNSSNNIFEFFSTNAGGGFGG